MRSIKVCIIALAAVGALTSPAQALPDTSELGAKTFDALLLRPLASIGTVAGFALFLPVALLTAPGGKDSINEAWDLFVRGPSDAAFQRPLGEF